VRHHQAVAFPQRVLVRAIAAGVARIASLSGVRRKGHEVLVAGTVVHVLGCGTVCVIIMAAAADAEDADWLAQRCARRGAVPLVWLLAAAAAAAGDDAGRRC
jgi:hypothetical protein